MKALTLILLFLSFSFMAEAKIHVKTIALKIAGSEQSYYLLYTVDKSYEYNMADSVYGRQLVSRHVLAERYNILDTILIASSVDLSESDIIKLHEFAGEDVYIDQLKKESEKTFSHWGFIKQITITTTTITCRYEKNKNLHVITNKSETKSYVEKTFYFWSIIILFILFCFGAWIFNFIYKMVNKKEFIFIDNPGEVFAYLIFFGIVIASINQSIICGSEFMIISLLAFLSPTIFILAAKYIYSKRN